MSLQYFKTSGKETRASEFHRRIAEAAFEAIYPDFEQPEDEEAESEQDKFMSDYKAALKAGPSQLSLFLITAGKPLLESDPNNYYNYLFCLGILVSDAADEAARTLLVNEIFGHLKAQLPDHTGTRIKILSYLFSTFKVDSLTRLTIFNEIVSACESNKSEFLYLAYVGNLSRILPIDKAPVEQLMPLYGRIIKTLREKERYSDLTKIVSGLFEELAKRPDEASKYKQEVSQYLCLVILNEEAIFQVEDLLCNKVVHKLLESDATLKQSWSKFTNGNLSEAAEFFKTNEASLKQQNISLEIVKDRMRYFKLSQIADTHQNILTAELATKIELPLDEVEFFLIKAIQYGYISALIDQQAKTVYFKEVHLRNLQIRGKKTLDERLGSVFAGLAAVFPSVSAAN